MSGSESRSRLGMLIDNRTEDGWAVRDVVLYMSMSLDGFVGSDREHPGMAIPEGAELKQWKLDHIKKAGAHLMGHTTYQEMSSYRPTPTTSTRPR